MRKEKIILLFSFVILFMMTLEVNAKPTISAPYFYKQMGGMDSSSDSVSSKYSEFNQILNDFVTEGGTYIKDEDLYNLDIDIVNNQKAAKQYNLVATADPAKGSWGKKDLELLYEEAKKGNHIKFEILAYYEGLKWESMSEKLSSNTEVYDKFLNIISSADESTAVVKGEVEMWVEKDDKNKYIWKTTTFTAEEIKCTEFKGKNINDMSEMFSGCKNLIKLDLSIIETDNVTNMDHILDECCSLKNFISKKNEMETIFDDEKLINQRQSESFCMKMEKFSGSLPLPNYQSTHLYDNDDSDDDDSVSSLSKTII